MRLPIHSWLHSNSSISWRKHPSHQNINDGNNESCFLLFLLTILLFFVYKTRMWCLSRKPPDGIHLFSICHFTINDSQLIMLGPHGPSTFSEPPRLYSRWNKEAKFYFHFHYFVSATAMSPICVISRGASYPLTSDSVND